MIGSVVRGGCVCALAMALVPYVFGAIDADEITSLPGWTAPLPTRQWSGYLNIGADSAVSGGVAALAAPLERAVLAWFCRRLVLP